MRETVPKVTGLDDERVHRILSLDGDDSWSTDLDRLMRGDASLTRRSAGEAGIRAVQRLLVFLGYSTTTTGSFVIDGDFGRGTNRGVAQFQFERRLTAIRRRQLCYPCSWNTASKLITAVPETRLDVATLQALLTAVHEAIASRDVTLGDIDLAISQLNAVDRRAGMSCRTILETYGGAARDAAERIRNERGVTVHPDWMLAIIRQETAGVIRPKFEQHVLTRRNDQRPRASFADLRYESMSIGLGQIMGFNFETVGAASARALVTSPLDEQVLFVARFLAQRSFASAVSRTEPVEDDFRRVARYYNGPGYAAHHYHESLERWFREFRYLQNA